ANWIPVSSLYHRDWSPTPAAQAYQDLIFKEWWTRASGTISKDGQYAVRGFYGTYRVTVDGVSREISLHQAEGKTVVAF
ncbi:MAG TPA: hypothetical protein VK666_05035, partial [Chryseolinea sp.]|nr:hypothetical protein [Chryseolinea sp.]